MLWGAQGQGTYSGAHPQQEGMRMATGTRLSAWTSPMARSPVPLGHERAAPQLCWGAWSLQAWVCCIGRISRGEVLCYSPLHRKRLTVRFPGSGRRWDAAPPSLPGPGRLCREKASQAFLLLWSHTLPLVRAGAKLAAAGNKLWCKYEGTDQRRHQGRGINPAKAPEVEAGCSLASFPLFAQP